MKTRKKPYLNQSLGYSNLMESTDSSSVSPYPPQLPPGFRFHPTDEELVVHYLKRKVASAPLPVTIMAEVDLYKFDPWELPSMATFGEQEWYFFSPRDRKYPNGARPNRASTSGYWKATGTDKPIVSTSNGNQKVGVKKALVFYGGKPPKGIKTNWIMHEYRLINNNSTSSKPQLPDIPNRKASSRLDDWVLCRIYKKNDTQRPMERDKDYSMEGMLATLPTSSHQNPKLPNLKATSYYGSSLEQEENFFQGILTGEDMQNTSNINSRVTAISSSSKQDLSMALGAATNTTNSVPVKRAVPAPQYWNEPNSTGSLSSKRFQGDLNGSSTAGSIDNTNSFVSLLNYQLPQSATFHPATLFGSIGDRQQFTLPSMNWNS